MAKVNEATNLAKEATSLTVSIQNHKNSVAIATKNPSLAPASPSWGGAFSLPPMVKLAVGVAAVAFGVAWVKREARRRTK